MGEAGLGGVCAGARGVGGFGGVDGFDAVCNMKCVRTLTLV